MLKGMAGFLLPYAVSTSTITLQRFGGTSDGTYRKPPVLAEKMCKNELEEGSCLIFKPNGDPLKLDLVAHINYAGLLALTQVK